MAETETETKTDLVRLEREGNVAVLVLDNPPLNLFSRAVFRDFVERLEEVADSDARALVWRAEGELFNGGADVNDFQRVVDEGGPGDSFGSLLDAAKRLEELPIPTLALAHGLCLTAGLETSLACDMLWASESARFGLVEAVVGLTPGAGGSPRVAAGRGGHRGEEAAAASRQGRGVRDERRDLRRRHAGALERREQGA